MACRWWISAQIPRPSNGHTRAARRCLVLAALLGAVLNQDAADRNQDSELLDLNT